jgi:peptide/nickel transport system permease protein
MSATPAEQFLPRAQGSRFWQRFRRHRLAVVGMVFMGILVVLALFAPLLATHDPYELDMRATKAPPSAEYLLGTDTAGRDMWTRLIYAGRISLSVGVVSVSIYITIGTILGALAAYYGGWVDSLIMRFTDTVMSFPDLIIIITVVAFIGPSIYNVMLAIGLLGWPGTCRLVRGQVLALREIEFIEAAHSTGLPAMRILMRHILPNVVPYLIVVATLGMAGAILTEAGLSFLGLGVQPPTPSWGNMLHSAQRLTLLEQFPHLWLPPGLMIAITVLSINFIGDALRDALDPRLTL